MPQNIAENLKLSFNIAESLENSQTQEDKIFCLTQAEQFFAEYKEKNEKEYYDLCSQKETVQKAREKLNTEIYNLKKIV